jgi:hypothetical protein
MALRMIARIAGRRQETPVAENVKNLPNPVIEPYDISESYKIQGSLCVSISRGQHDSAKI